MPTAEKAVLNVTDLESLLGSGDVQVTTTGESGVEAKDLIVDAALSWSNQSNLALNAHRSISINRPISVVGQGGLSLGTARSGTLSFGTKGNVSFANVSSALAINGAAYILVSSISALAGAIASNPGGSYALANNYDASQDGTYSDSPVGTELTGAVQGLGNVISNLSINSRNAKDTVGLFTGVAGTGSVADLRLHKLNTTVTKNAGGGLVGYNQGYLFGDDAHGSSFVRGGGGGLVGGNSGTITKSAANVRIKGTGDLGGLAGGNQGTISLSHASGDVHGGVAGGLVGDNDNGLIAQSYATGAVAGAHPGGLAGRNESSGTIIDSYSTGSVRGSGYFDGGLVADDDNSAATVTSSYSTGAVTAGGGFVCTFEAGSDFTNDYWDTTTSGQSDGTCNGNIVEITGVTTEQLQSGLPAGFDPTIWAENPNINNGFPYLINNPPPK